MVSGKPGGGIFCSRAFLLFSQTHRRSIDPETGMKAIFQEQTVLSVAVFGTAAKQQRILYPAFRQDLLSGRNAVSRVTAIIVKANTLEGIIPIGSSAWIYTHIKQNHVCLRMRRIFLFDPLRIPFLIPYIFIRKKADFACLIHPVHRRISGKTYPSFFHTNTL